MDTYKKVQVYIKLKDGKIQRFGVPCRCKTEGNVGIRCKDGLPITFDTKNNIWIYEIK